MERIERRRRCGVGARFGLMEGLEGRVMLSVAATSQIAATTFSDQSGVASTGSSVGSLDAGDWIKYSDIDFGAGVGAFLANIGTPYNYDGGHIEVHVDSLTSAAAATLQVSASGSFGNRTTQTAFLQNDLTGVHDIYLVMSQGRNLFGGTGIGDLAWISFSTPAATAVAPARNYSDQSGMTSAFMDGNTLNGTAMAYIDNGDWIKFSAMDFGTGVGGFEAALGTPAAYAGGRVTVHVDSTNGPVVASLQIASTGSWSTMTVQGASMTSSPTGVHDVYLVFSTGTNTEFGTGLCSLDWVRFEPVTVAAQAATSTIQAENYDARVGRELLGTAGVGNTTVGNLITGDVLEYDGVDFGAGATTFEASIGTPVGYAGGVLQVYVDGGTVDGRLVAALTIGNTGGWGTLSTQTAALLSSVTGVHDVYLVLETGANPTGGYGLGALDWVSFS